MSGVLTVFTHRFGGRPIFVLAQPKNTVAQPSIKMIINMDVSIFFIILFVANVTGDPEWIVLQLHQRALSR